ncbi:MAG: conjugal transfer protein TraF, partial [Pseudomonadota bacterium]
MIQSRTSRVFLTAAVLFSPVFASLSAQQPIVGPRAAGMGGAQTSTANDSTALWANTAGLGADPRLDFDLFGSALATDRGGFQASVNVLSPLNPNSMTPSQATSARAALTSLGRLGVGAVASGVGGLVVAERGLAVGVGEVAYAGVYPIVDLVHTSPVHGSNGFENNTSAVNSIGLEARELRIGYAYGLYGRTLLIGTAARYIRGIAYYDHTSVFDVSQTDLAATVVNAFKADGKTTGAFTFDVGILVNVISTVKVGINATSLTEPKFYLNQSTTDPALSGAPAFVRLPRTVRAGASVTPMS